MCIVVSPVQFGVSVDERGGVAQRKADGREHEEHDEPVRVGRRNGVARRLVETGERGILDQPREAGHRDVAANAARCDCPPRPRRDPLAQRRERVGGVPT